jgi:hypothetical protein
MSTVFQVLTLWMCAGGFVICTVVALAGSISKDERKGVSRDVTPSEAQW